MTDAEACRTGEEHCITCGDQGIPMRVLEAGSETAMCADDDGVRHPIDIELVGPVAVGDELLVHAGVAIANLQAASG